MNRDEPINLHIERLGRLSLLAGLLGLALCAVAFFQNQVHFFHSFLFGWVFWMTLTAGCLGLTLMQHTVRGSWGYPILRILEAAGGPGAIVLMAVLFILIVAGSHTLYPWADTARVAAGPILRSRAGFYTLPFWTLRATIYFFIMWAGSAFLRRYSRLEDQTGDGNLAQLRTNVAAPGIVVYFIVMTLAFVEWVMTLDPHYYSSIWGIWFVIASGLAAWAFCTILITRWLNLTPYRDAVDAGVLRDLGNFMLTFTMLWAYMSLSQFLIQWSGNLPNEVNYYLRRYVGGLRAMGGFIVVGQFFFPFTCLLSSNTKRRPPLLFLVACWILFVHLVDIYWTVKPMFPESTAVPVWSDFAAVLGIGGLWLATFAAQLKQAALIPRHQRAGQEALSHA